MFKLKGNDFTKQEIEKWYAEEEDYHNQFTGGRNETDEYWPVYEEFNRRYAINKHVKFTTETKVLSFGCAEGSDTSKLYKEHKFKLFGLEASEQLINAFKKNFPEACIVKASIDGKINYPADFFDYIFCFGVLHHIPNVSFVLEEFHRVLKKDGIAIIREPVCRMYTGEVRPKELSPNERGIPVEFFKEEFQKLNFEILDIRKSYYKPLMHIIRKANYLSEYPVLMYLLDNITCRLSSAGNYYNKSILDRFTANCAYYVVRKV